MTPKNHRPSLFHVLPVLLLAVWYLLSVTGIDVHRDAEHGETYVVWGLNGCDCERIHPEHLCHDHGPAEGACLDGEDCCSDSFEAVLSVGSGPDAPVVPAAALTGTALPPAAMACPAVPVPCVALRGHAPPPGGGVLLSHICVLRV